MQQLMEAVRRIQKTAPYYPSQNVLATHITRIWGINLAFSRGLAATLYAELRRMLWAITGGSKTTNEFIEWVCDNVIPGIERSSRRGYRLA